MISVLTSPSDARPRMTRQRSRLNSPENPLINSECFCASNEDEDRSPLHLFVAKKRGRRNPVYKTRYFVCDIDKRQISYWATREDASSGDLAKRKGVISVKRAQPSNTKENRQKMSVSAAREAARESRDSSLRKISRSLLQRHNAASDTDLHADLHACILELEDDNGRILELKGLQTRDMDLIVKKFSGAASFRQYQKTSSLDANDPSLKDMRMVPHQTQAQAKEALRVVEKEKAYQELNNVRTELRLRNLDTIGKRDVLWARLAEAKARGAVLKKAKAVREQKLKQKTTP